jgi:hypothetical protein
MTWMSGAYRPEPKCFKDGDHRLNGFEPVRPPGPGWMLWHVFAGSNPTRMDGYYDNDPVVNGYIFFVWVRLSVPNGCYR